MKNKKEIIFLVSSETLFGVLESQVFKLADFVASNYKTNVKVVLVGKELQIDEDKYSERLDFHYLNKTITINEIKNSRIYIRTIDVFLKNYIRFKINKNEIIYDFRALLFAESFSRNKNYLRASYIFFLEMITYVFADKVCCVSVNLKKKLYSLFLIKKRIYVFPCLIPNKGRTKLTIDNNQAIKPVEFVYLGSVSDWQKFDTIVDIYKEYSRSSKKSNLTVITKDKDQAISILKDKKLVAKVKSLSNEEVLKDLPNYNFGFLVRDDNLLNNVSSPIKFLEYLSCGVIPIMTEGIGDYSQEVQTNDIAIVLKEDKFLVESEINRFLNDALLDKRIENYYNGYIFEDRIKKHPLLKNL